MKINNLVLIILSIIVFYLLLTKQENMSNTDIKKIVNDLYQADIQSIRNLSKLANDLTNTGKLVVPGGLEIKGNLKIDGNVGIKRDPHPKVGLIINGKGLIWGLETVNSGIQSSGKIKGGSLQIENSSMFGTKSGRPLRISSSNWKNEQTYLGFYNGNRRTSYLLPRTDGSLYNSNKFHSGGALHSNDEISASKGLFTNCSKYGTPSSNCGIHLRPDGYVKCKRLDIMNGVGGTTHFNYDNKGENYFRGPLNQFQEDVRLRKYNSLRVYGGCGMGGDKRLHWGCNAKHAFS